MAFASLLYAAGAGAQFTGSASVVSDYRFRGVSLSRQNPAAQATVVYDGPGGTYGGVFGSTVRLADASAMAGQAVTFLGAVTPIGGGFNWDVGAAYSVFSTGRDYDYGEAYTGITSRNFNAQVHYSPSYFGLARGSFYGEINGTRLLDDGFVLLGHVGVLVPAGHGDDPYAAKARNRLDARAGVGLEAGGFGLRFVWVGTVGTGSLYPIAGSQRRSTAVMSVSRPF